MTVSAAMMTLQKCIYLSAVWIGVNVNAPLESVLRTNLTFVVFRTWAAMAMRSTVVLSRVV